MEEQPVLFETAKLAKEKGFDEYYMDCYDPNGKIIPLRNQAALIEEVFCSAPTQALLQKWFREVWRIEVFVYCNASGWMWEINKAFSKDSFSGGTSVKWSEETGPNESGEWDTYEEALEVGLFEALKLIK